MSAAQEGRAGQRVGQAAGGEGEEGEELGLLMVWSESALSKLVGQLVESWLTVGDVIKDDSDAEKARERGTQFSRVPCTKVHTLTQQALGRGPSARDLPAFLAVLVQKCTY